MQRYGELLTFYSSFTILSLIIISVNSNNNVSGQPLPDSSDLSVPFPSTSKSDVELIGDIINRQGQINEPEKIEPEVQTRTDGSQDDSDSIADGSDRNGEVKNENDSEISDANEHRMAFSEEDEDADRQKEVSLDEDRKDSQPSLGSEGVYVVDYMNIRIQEFDSNGKFMTTWGSERTGDSQFSDPHSVAA